MQYSVGVMSSRQESAIVVQGLTKRYGELSAVDHASFQVRRGEMFGFLGPNGAGKTTTIRMIIGLARPTDGQAWIEGRSVRQEPTWVKERIGTVPETSNLYGELSSRDNLLFMAQLYGITRGERAGRVEELLEQFGLAERGDSRFQSLSRGLKRRLTIAAALIHHPTVVFLDEPTTGLDVVSARSLRVLVRELRRQGCTIFLTTHYIAEAGELCDRIAIIVKGRIKTVGTPAELQEMTQGRQVLEIAFSRWDEALQAKMEVLPGIERAWPAGGKLRIHADDLTQTLARVTDFARSAGLEILSINTLLPTLEDAFVQLTGISSEAMGAGKSAPGGER